MQLKDYFNVIRTRWWLAAIAIVVAAGVAFVYSSGQPKLYESTVTLIGKVGKQGDAGLYNGLQQQLQSYTARFTSTDLANQINQDGKLDLNPDQIISEMHVQSHPTDYTFVITVDDASPERAKKIADVSADFLVIENQIAIAGLNPDQQVYVQKNAPASLPDKPYSPRTLLLTGAGAGLGLVFGAILMFVIEFLDDTLKDPSDIERYSGLNTLGQIPRRKTSNSRSQSTLGQMNISNNSINKATSEQPTIQSKP